MKFLKSMLSEETMNELNQKLGADLIKQVNEKLGDYSISPGKEKWIPKTVYDEDKASLKRQLDERDKQFKELKESTKDHADLTAKIEELEKTNKANKESYEKDLAATRQGYALQSKISGANSKNPKALEALLDKSKITYEDDGNGGYTVKGVDEQVEALKKSDSYLFPGLEQGSSNPQNPPTVDPAPSGDVGVRSCFGLDTASK